HRAGARACRQSWLSSVLVLAAASRAAARRSSISLHLTRGSLRHLSTISQRASADVASALDFSRSSASAVFSRSMARPCCPTSRSRFSTQRAYRFATSSHDGAIDRSVIVLLLVEHLFRSLHDLPDKAGNRAGRRDPERATT